MVGFGKFRMHVVVFVVVATLVAPCATLAQVTDTRELQVYLTAITHTSGTERTNALRGFLQAWPQSSLRVDALKWLAWDSHLSDRSSAIAYAKEVLELDPRNAFATAVELDNVTDTAGEKTYKVAQAAIEQLTTMRPPAGMGAQEFYRVQQFATAALCAAVGSVQLHRKDYESARAYLRRAATLSPHDARYAYFLGLADLSGKNTNDEEGYFYLARAVDLAGNAPAAREIDQYARRHYQKAGGTSADWDRFLAAAIVPGTAARETTAVVVAAPPASAPAGIAAPAGIPPSGSGTAAVTTASLPKVSTRDTHELPKVSDLPPPKTAESEITDLGLPGPDAAHRQPFHPGAPVSLGILIESSLIGGYRTGLVNTLGDLVRHLAANENNEAFVLSFGKSIAFRQDLTGNTKALEKAIDKIRPAEGTALLDAVTLAAFQLNRVSREGNNRVLLVISDGKNLDSKMPSLWAMSQLESGAVRVYCIGLGPLANDGQLLQTLASRTGGEVRFVNDVAMIRGTAREMADEFGVHFPY